MFVIDVVTHCLWLPEGTAACKLLYFAASLYACSYLMFHQWGCTIAVWVCCRCVVRQCRQCTAFKCSQAPAFEGMVCYMSVAHERACIAVQVYNSRQFSAMVQSDCCCYGSVDLRATACIGTPCWAGRWRSALTSSHVTV